MEDIFALITSYQNEFAKQPFFAFMRDTSINLEERLAWMPCLTHIAMGFADVWKYDFRDESSNDEIQQLINKHTYEDEDHWIWFIEDLKHLGFDKSFNFSDTLKLLWGEETTQTRLVPHTVATYVRNAEPIVKLAAIEAIEATFYIFICSTIPLIQEVRKITNLNYHYIGGTHLEVEKSHTIRQMEIKQMFYDIQLNEQQRLATEVVIEKVFQLFSDSMSELLTYAKNHASNKLVAA
jgi:hypothetical protein